jgi:hypothetical protein
MDLVVFTGSLSTEELGHERADELARLRAEGVLELQAAPAPAAATVRRAYAVGAVGLALGLALVVLIVFAVAR